ncbi:MAG: hypothetical protein OEZ43_17825 [Gammaproteobacteria bacterium]|nr:hypothetical protein [Gammaproteobacteria bacterium]
MRKIGYVTLVVITIIATIFLVPQYFPPDDSRCMGEIARMHSVKSAITKFKNKYNRLPSDVDPWPDLAEFLGYNATPLDRWGNEYVLKFGRDKKTIEVFAKGFDENCH